MQKEKFQLSLHNDESIAFQSQNWTVEMHAISTLIWRVSIYKSTTTKKSKNVFLDSEILDKRQTFSFYQSNNEIHIWTDTMKAVISLPDFKIKWYLNKLNSWQLLFEDRKTQSYNFSGELGEGMFHYVQRDIDDIYFGLGEKSGSIIRNENRYRIDAIDCMGYNAEKTDPLYKHFPYYICKTNNGYFALSYNSMVPSTIDLGKELDNYHGLYTYYNDSNDYLDYFVMGGESLKDIVPSFAELAGTPLFPPYYSIGYLASSMLYADDENAQTKLEMFLNQCEKLDIPINGFHLSSGYTLRGNKRYVFTWNNARFPNPKELFKKFDDKGIKIIANIKPCLLNDHPLYSQCQEEGLLVKDALGNPLLSQFWDGLGSYLDFSNPKTWTWWEENVKHQLLDYGISATWNDNNEFEIWDDSATCYGLDGVTQANKLRPYFTRKMLESSYKAQEEYFDTQRLYLISRSGSHGMQSLVQTWSGDNNTAWNTLRFNHKMGIGMSLSGIYNFGHDVGGFAGPKPNAELFVRWVQHGIFMPRFSIHSWNDDGSVNEPWMYPEYTNVVRDLILTRYKIMPHLYSLLYKSHAQFKPIVNAIFYNYPTYTDYESDLYMLGESMLVANVFDENVDEVVVDFPDGSWYELCTHVKYEGNTQKKFYAPLNNTIVSFMKAGSILMINPSIHGFKQTHDALHFQIFAKDNGSFEESFFYDNGISRLVNEGNDNLIFVKVNSDETEHTIEVILNKVSYIKNISIEVIDEKERHTNVFCDNYDVSIRKERIYIER